MSPEAERLREKLASAVAYTPYAKDIARVVVTELGITDEMVKRVTNAASLPDPYIRKAKLRKAADALATLLEVSRQP